MIVSYDTIVKIFSPAPEASG